MNAWSPTLVKLSSPTTSVSSLQPANNPSGIAVISANFTFVTVLSANAYLPICLIRDRSSSVVKVSPDIAPSAILSERDEIRKSFV